MKREAIDLYAANKTPLEKLVLIGVNRKDLTRESVYAAAEQLYEEVQNGLKVLPVRVAWEVFSRAKNLKGAVEKAELDKTIELQNVHDDLRERYDILQGEYKDLEEVLKEVQSAFSFAMSDVEIKNADIERYQQELDWYEESWWRKRRYFRRPPNA